METGLKQKVALVTGGARDVGRGIAMSLAAEGALVALNYSSSSDEADAVVAEIRAAGGTAIAIGADVTNLDEVKAMVDTILREFGRIDILVNNAGLVIRKRFLETTQEDWDRQVGVGFYGVIHTCHTIIPHMIKNNYGRIINLGGDSSRVGEAGLSVTAASRGGILAFTKSIAQEFGRNLITANAVTLGLMNTAHNNPKWLEDNLDKILRNYAIRRIGESDDVAPLVTLLASEKAGWITGQVISVNGGFCMV